MTSDVLDLDDIAADDALIESIRYGAVRDDLPDGDPAVDVLLAVRDGAQAPAAARSVAGRTRRAIATRVVSHRRAIAVSAIAGIAVTTGVGAAVAGDPTAAFKYVFDRGVEIGSRFGTPGGNSSAAGDVVGRPHAVGMSTPPVRQGAAAAPLGESREDTSVGFVRDPDYWLVPTPRGLEEFVDGESDSSGDDEIATTGGTTTTEVGPGESPGSDEPVVTTAETQDPESDGPGPSDGPTTTMIVPPTEGTTDPTTSPPTETAITPPPTETTITPPPTETTPPPTETTTPPPSETTSPPTDTTSPPSSAPTTSSSSESPTP
ncbi:hypothetical protein [Solicola gregarius]|uniref:Uncharacterized protein n=1 Tax=Solicola gregarius TaxID=2908642 RepID=A0AA46TFH7_9ACTN|nr:hypothetical protein [Solicola gregarius]UYM03857.1 hypothetical protein L0C25_15055 [Solicola gregarius]